MTSTDTAGALRLTARLALLEWRAVFTNYVLAVSTIPRLLLQVAFYCLLGRYAGGEPGLAFAFVGASLHIGVVSTVVRGPDVLVDEKVQGTMYRLRLARLPLVAILLTRWWVSVAEGLVSVLIAILVVGPLFGLGDMALRLLSVLPLHALTVCSTVGLGLFVAAVSAGRRADVLVTNLFSYATLLLCGVVAPVDALGPLGVVGQALPLTNGLLAVRAALEGVPWVAFALREVAFGIAWGAAGVVVLRFQARRARRAGHDDFF